MCTRMSEAFYFMSVYTNDSELYPLNDIITVTRQVPILILRKRLVCIV